MQMQFARCIIICGFNFQLNTYFNANIRDSIYTTFGESKGLPAELKVEMILAQEEKIRKSAELLKDIQEKSAVLNADAILTYTQPECERNLIKLSTIQLEQEVKCNRLNESTLELVEKYNDVISTIAETFVRYDEMLRALEESKSSTSIESR